MKIFCNTLSMTLSLPDQGSTAWFTIWTKIPNPYGERVSDTYGLGENDVWVKFPLSPQTERLPIAGEFIECGTACKTIRGEVISAVRNENDGLDVEVGQPSFPYDGPPINWETVLAPTSGLKADCLGMESRLVALIDGAYQSILDGGDVDCSLPLDDCPVQSSLSEGIVTWAEYQKIRQKNIPNGGAVPEKEQEIRDITYLCAGNRDMAKTVTGN